MNLLLALDLHAEPDVFVVRQRAREVAVALRLEGPDPVRVATAVSEVGRDLLAAGGGRVVFTAAAGGPLRVELTARAAASLGGAGTAAARRLVDEVEVGTGDDGRAVVVLVKALPRLSTWSADAVRRSLRASPTSPMSELRAQNRELLAALGEVSAKQEQLERLNLELELTNRGVVALYVDLEEKQEQLLEADRAKSRFLASVSHELRGPVASVLGLSRLLMDPAADALTAEQQEQVHLVSSCAQDLLDLVNELLDLAKAEAGRLEPEPQPVDLRVLLADLVGTVRPLASPETVLLLDVAAELPALVVTDPTLLRQVLRNLLTNSLKFTERGEVRLRAAVGSGRLVVRVEDTGIGIAEDDRSRVFEEFFQVPGPWQARVRGTGLGLPHARRLAVVLGGSLRLDSQLGRGTTVTLEVPLVVAQASEHGSGQGTEQGSERSTGQGSEQGSQHGTEQSAGHGAELAVTAPHFGTVLVADDDPAFRGLLRSELATAADVVLEAADGEEALAQLSERDVDLLFLDLRMPRLNGAEVLNRVRADPSLARLVVVVVTAVEVTTLDRSRLTAADATLSKTHLTREGLMACLRRAVRPRADGVRAS